MRYFRKTTTRPNRRISRIQVTCLSGPLTGKTLNLDRSGQLTTLPFVLYEQAGRYVSGQWEAA